MSSEKSADQNLYMTDNSLGGQHEVNDGKIINEEKNNNKTIDGASFFPSFSYLPAYNFEIFS